jgi:nickel/cobalt transporter (NiCoT) family protein
VTPVRYPGAATFLVITAAAIVGIWSLAWAAFANRPALLGLALLAWVFGLGHGVDADHIAAIDNAARRLRQSGRAVTGVGGCFSLRHSSVVAPASAAIVAGNRGP